MSLSDTHRVILSVQLNAQRRGVDSDNLLKTLLARRQDASCDTSN